MPREELTLPGMQSTTPWHYLQAKRDHYHLETLPVTEWITETPYHAHDATNMLIIFLYDLKPGCKTSPVVSEGTVKGQLVYLEVREIVWLVQTTHSVPEEELLTS